MAINWILNSMRWMVTEREGCYSLLDKDGIIADGDSIFLTLDESYEYKVELERYRRSLKSYSPFRLTLEEFIASTIDDILQERLANGISI